MKTSPSQYEMLMTYMEQHGDLSKLSTTARGRITSIREWENLAGLLNSDGAGATKTTEKWKKVWSDFKNNTKKKAARLHRAATGTGGGPAVFAKLSDLEQRVLNLMGLQVATGLAIEEAGLSQEVHIQPIHYENVQDEFGEYSQNVNQDETNASIPSSTQPPLPPSLLLAISSPPHMFVEEEVESSQPNWHEPGPLRLSNAPAQTPAKARPTMALTRLVEPQVEVSQPNWHEPGPSRSSNATAHTPHIIVDPLVEVIETGLLSPTRPTTDVRVGQGLAASAQTTPRRARRTREFSPTRPTTEVRVGQRLAASAQTTPRARRTRGSPRRRTARPAHTEQAAQQFLQADTFWRNFKEQQHNDNIRIRELELQTQRGWQDLSGRLVNVLEKLADKYCKD